MEEWEAACPKQTGTQLNREHLAWPAHLQGGVVGGGGISAVRKVHIKGSKHDINNVPS